MNRIITFFFVFDEVKVNQLFRNNHKNHPNDSCTNRPFYKKCVKMCHVVNNLDYNL